MNMKFKIDENLPVEAAIMLRQAGYTAATVVEQQLGGETDRTIAAICRIEQRVIITLDIDFADIRAYPSELYAGIIILRLKLHDKPAVLKLLGRVIQTLPQESVTGKLWIVDEQKIRIRG